MLSPAALSNITTTFTGSDRTKALGVWGAVGGAGAAIGVLLGGVLTEAVDWRAIFLINLPVGIGVAVAASNVIPADVTRPRWRGLDLRGALVATASLGALVFALSQASDAGWTSLQTLGLGIGGLAGLGVFAALERGARTPLLNVSRLGERGVGGGFVMMLAASAVLFGSFLLTSIYLQDVLGASALETGLAFLPMAVIIGLGAHLGSHLVAHAGLRVAMSAAFALTAGGMLLLSGVDSGGNYLADVLPGMLVAGLGLGITLVGVALSVLTGAAHDEAGMLSGLNTTGHEIGGSLGVAVLVTIATGAIGTGAAASTTGLAGGLGDAFLVSGVIAAAAAVIAQFVLPSSATFLPKLRHAPRVAVH
jgi:MFS family permease